MNLGPITGFEDFNKEIAHELAARHGIDVEAELQKHLENGSLTTTAVPGHSGVSGYDSTEMERLRNLRKGYSGMSAISGSTSMYGWEKGYSGQSGVSGHSGTSYYPGRSGVSGHSGVKMYPDLPSENMEVKSKMVTKNGVPEIVYYVEAKPIPGEQYVALNERFEPIILSKDEWYRTFHEQNGGGQKETPKKETAQTNKDYEEYLDAQRRNLDEYRQYVESHRDYIASLEKPAHEVVGRRVVQEVYPHSAAEHPDVLNEVRKVNWKSVAVGIAASVVIALTLSPDVGRNIWHFIISIFK